MSRPLLGIIGQRGSGKDAVASVLVEHYGYLRLAYADALKSEVIQAIGLSGPPSPHDYLHDGSIGEILAYIEAHKQDPLDGPTGWCRQLLQAWGVMRRDLNGPTYWVRKVPVGEGIVVTDVRFPSELAHIQEHDGLIVRVSRPGYDGDGHESEKHVRKFPHDYLLQNDQDLATLNTNVHLLASELGLDRVGAP